MDKAALITALFDVMGRLRRRMHAGAERFLGSYQLTRPQLEILFLLERETELTVSEVASRTGVTNGAATQTLDVMVRRGLVNRQQDNVDRRVSQLSLTGPGRTLAEQVTRAQTERLSALVGNLDESELAALVQALGKLCTVMEAASESDHDRA